jgi:2-dehydropantoate 2-reductase
MAAKATHRPRLAVLGAGAIGSFLGGMMARAGQDVTLVDPWPEHINAIRADGLRIAVTEHSYLARPAVLHLHQLQAVDDPFDVIFLAVKAYDTDWAATLATRYLHKDGAIVVCQNGVTDTRVAAIAGAERVVGCVIIIAAALPGPGFTQRTDTAPLGFKIGELDGPAGSRARSIAGLIGSAAPAETTDDLTAERWSKLALNCMINPVAGVSGYGAGEVRSLPQILPVIVQLAVEVISVAVAQGIEIAPMMGISPQVFVEAAQTGSLGPLGAQIREASRSSDRHPPSLLQDLRNGRRTEIHELNGFVAERGRLVRVPTPLCDEVTRIIGSAPIGKLQPDPGTIDRLRKLVPFRYQTQ